MSTSTPQTEPPVDENIPTAIIYSISDIAEYIVEICHHNHHFFIGAEHNQQEPTRFGNLGEAKAAALKYKVEKFFLALNKVYQEVQEDSHSQLTKVEKFDYMPL